MSYTDHGNTGSSESIDFGTSEHRLVFDAATVTLSPTGLPAAGTPGVVRLYIVQDGTGNRHASWWAGITWIGGLPPVLQAAPGAIDQVDLTTVDGGTSYLGVYTVISTGTVASAAAPTGDALVEDEIEPFVVPSRGLRVVGSDGSLVNDVAELVTDRVQAGTDGNSAILRGLASTTIGCAVYNSSNKTLSTGGEGVFTFDSEVFDTDGFHDNSTNAQRFTVPAGMAGRYLLIVGLHASSNPSGGYVIARKNGSVVALMAEFIYDSGGGHGTATGSCIVDMAGGDYIEFKTLASSGATITGGTSWVPQAAFIKLDSGRMGGGIGCKAYSSVTQSVTSGVEAALTFDSEEFDTDGFHSTASNTSRFTIPTGMGGIYAVHGGVYQGTAAYQVIRFRKNGSTYIRAGAYSGGGVSGDGPQLNATTVVQLAAGDYIEVMYQGGSTQSIGSASDPKVQAWASIMRLDSNASGVLAQAVGNRSGADITTSSTSFVDIGSEFTQTLTTGARRVLVLANISLYQTAGDNVAFDISIDGVSQGGTQGVARTKPDNRQMQTTLAWVSGVLAAGSHTIKLRWASIGGATATLVAGGIIIPQFAVVELPDSGALAGTPVQPPSGPAFPANPSTGQLWFRTDFGVLFFYDGTRWLTESIYHATASLENNTASPGDSLRIPTANPLGLDLWIVSIDCDTYTAATNNGSNYWTVALQRWDSANAYTTPTGASFTTAADTQAVWIKHEVAVGQSVALATYFGLRFDATKTGTPGALYAALGVAYRLIGV